MSELNRAYHVLADPVARRAYDRELDGTARSAPGTDTGGFGTSLDDEVPVRPAHPFAHAAGQALSPPGPARFPWRMVLLGSAIGAMLVIGVSAYRGPARVTPPDGVLQPGVSCVEIEPNTDVHEVACAPGVNLVVESIVADGELCPAGLVGHRDRQGSGTACLAERTLEG